MQKCTCVEYDVLFCAPSHRYFYIFRKIGDPIIVVGVEIL